MKKTFQVWAGLSFIFICAAAFVNEANHPEVQSLLKLLGPLSLFPILLLAYFIRSKVFQLTNDWVDYFSVSFLVGFLVFLGGSEIPSVNSASLAQWYWAAGASFLLAVLLGWEFWSEKISGNRLFKKVRPVTWPLLFALVCAGLGLVDWKADDACFLAVLGLSPLARFYIAKKEPEALKAIALLVGTLVLISRASPAQEAPGIWRFVILTHHLLLSGLFFIYWEKMKEKGGLKILEGVFLFAALPMIPYYYLGYGNWSWPCLMAVLGLLWAWDPWLKPYQMKVPLGLASIGVLIYFYQATESLELIIGVLGFTILTGQIRLNILKLPQDLIKGLALYTFTAVLIYHYGSTAEQVIAHWTWIAGVHFSLAAVFHLFWEKLKVLKNKKLFLLFLAASLIPIPFTLYAKSIVWTAQVLLLWFFWLLDGAGKPNAESPLKSPSRDSGKSSSMPRLVPGFLRNLPWQGDASQLFKNSKVRKITLGAVVLILGALGFNLFYERTSTHIVSFTPSGVIGSANTIIKAKFSGDVSVSGSLDSAFQIDPPLPGVTRLEDSTTLVFTPQAPLKPATEYRVKLSTGGLKSKQWFLQGSAQTKFSTEPLKVVTSRLFYNYDLVKNSEKELAGELEFNYPVELGVLKKNLSVTRKGAKLDFGLEQGTLPTRFYFKAGGIERELEDQVLTITLNGDLTCLDCGKPFGDTFKKTITLPAKPKLLVSEIKLHHAPGTSLISVLFTLPVSATQAKNNITIDPPIPYKVDTEYCYSVLKADFEPNQDYTIHVKEGLRAISGEVLEKSSEQKIRLADKAPYVHFADEGRLIPLEGGKIVEVDTMNLDNFTVDVEKVFRNNLVHYLHNSSRYSNYFYNRSFRNRGGGSDEEEEPSYRYGYESTYVGGIGVPIWSGGVTIEGGEINQENQSAMNFNKWHKAPYKGLFVVSLSGPNGGGRDSRSFLCTDLGMMMKQSGEDFLVQVISISKLTPLEGVKLQLVSDNNQVIQEKPTDAEGRAWFKNWRKNPYNFSPYVIVAQKADDWSYLRLDEGPLNQSRFDIGGDPFDSKGWDAFLTSDRGLYRPGEQANFTAVVRHGNLSTAKNLPVNLTIRDASGNQVAKMVSRLREFGMVTFAFPIKEEITTGKYSVDLGLENGVQLASLTIKVEEFIPNKIRVEVKADKKTALAGEPLSFQVVARQLFGAAGADLKAHAAVKLTALEFMDKNWKSYHFSDSTRQFAVEYMKIPDGITNAQGVFNVQLPIPDSLRPPSMIQAEVYGEALDSGGRPVGANAMIKVHKYPYYLGLKCLEGKEAKSGKKVHLKFIAITPDGKPTLAKKVTLLVKRKVWYSIFRKSGWSSRSYDSASYEQVIEAKEIDLDGKGSYDFVPDKEGEYTIYLGNEDSMRSSLMVAVTGAGRKGAVNLEDPDKLALALNRKEYKVGDVPRLEIWAPFAGRLVLTLEREQVFFTRTLSVSAGLNVVSLPAVKSDYLPNVYVVGLLVRKPEESLRTLPMSSFGVLPLAVNTSGREIKFKWKAPDSVKSRKGIDVRLSTGNPGAKVVLAAVDEGILDIISFKTPDPFKHFYRKRGLSTSTLNLFDQVLPDLRRKQAVGGDEGEGFGFRHLNPLAAKRVKSFALFSGILTAGKDGQVKYHFPTDKFHGEARVMVLGVKDNKFGGAAYHVKVADPVVVDPSFPRFLAPGDHFDIPVLLYNNTKSGQKIHVRITSKGPAGIDGSAEQDVTLEAEGQKQILFHGKASSDQAGIAEFKVTVTDGKGEKFDVDTELSVRPGNPLVTSVNFGQLGTGEKAALSVPGGFIPQGERIRLTVSSSPLLTFLGSLDYLINYPYGCAEQKTSEAFPLLYFKNMGLLTGRFSGRANAVEMFVQDAIDDLSKMQLADGSFALWPGDTEGLDYLSNYVSNFLILAQKEGYRVNQEVMGKILNRLGAIQVTGKSVGRLDRRKQNVEIQDNAYVLYLKALAGKPDVESMAALKANLKDRPIMDKCFLSLAYSELGDRKSALVVLPKKYLPSGLVRQLSGEWSSPNREMALYLLALSSADPSSGEIPKLIMEFGKKLKDGHFGTTQEDAWAFIALGKAAKVTTEAFPLKAQWSIKGGTPKTLQGETSVVKGEKLSGQKVDLKNLGGKDLYFHLLAEGTKLKAEKETVSNGLTVSREYRDENGARLNLGSVEQGQLVVVTLKVTCAKELDNLVVVDLLPAGFEVDNPRLSSRGKLGFEPETSFSPAFRDFRDDRVLLFSKKVSGDLSFSYSVRAVTPGTFQVPGITAEAMYDPEIYGRSNKGETLVVAPSKH